MVPWRRWRFLASRRQIGLLSLAGALGVGLAASLADISSAYRLAAVRQALRRGDADGARTLLEQHAVHDEQSSQFHYLSACAARRGGELSDAKRHLELAKNLGWPTDDIRREGLLIRARDGRIKEVEGQLAELLQAGQSDEAAEEIYEAMAQAYLASFFVEDAVRCLTYWSQWQPKNLLPRLWMADLDERIENPIAAIAEYRKILEIEPDHPEVLAKLGRLLLDNLEVDEAVVLFSRCLALAPETPLAALGLAECRRRQGANQEAKDLLNEALPLDLTPNQVGVAMSSLGKIALEDRDYARAVQMLEESVALDPNEASSRVALAAALSAVGQDEQAAAERQRASEMVARNDRLGHLMREIATKPSDPDLRCEAGLILMEQGFAAAGAGWLKTALEVVPDHRAAHDGLAKYNKSIGDLDRPRQRQSAAKRDATPARRPGETSRRPDS